MIEKVELRDGYSIVVENNSEKKETQMGIEGWQLIFTTREEVERFIALLNKGLEFWEYENKEQVNTNE